ncbi:CocE/NonD family hydrolase [Haloechinothrix sp. LS1_15]|uniref:CocE/NonD family hydrolase n=1 Tax=Haloechinothrix sp. LS1_15 TaxID=2652248 RepID=UPI00294B851C|nr:CocE/NonD family hydrolase [Haloechinothrix sp. LS1_15]
MELVPALGAVIGLLAALLVVHGAPQAAAAPNTYVTMPDGVEIALNVRLPDDYQEDRTYPTVFEMSGYDGGSASEDSPIEGSRQLTERFNEDYVTIHASIRGTGCSGGEFDLFSYQTAEDGRYIIDEWIAQQPWSNGDVAIMGHSYGGITGFMVASAQPEHLRAITVSGLIDDLYRGIVYPGGVVNYGFPLLWAGGLRPAMDLGGGVLPGLLFAESDEEFAERQQRCATNQLTKRRTVLDDPLLQGLNQTDSEWYRTRSSVTYADRIEVPVHITHAYQDEQTGPRGAPHLWEKVDGVPKRMLLTNGDHATQNPAAAGPEVWRDRVAWIDHFTGVERTPEFGPAGVGRTSVTTLLETHRDGDGELTSNGRIDSTEFPLENTDWTDFHLGADGSLTPGQAAPGSEGTSTYLSGTRRQAWSYHLGPAVGAPLSTADAPDELTYRTEPVDEPTALVGPMTATLHLSSTGVDTELFVQLIDEAPDGSRSYLQRGLLKASHRSIDDTRSDYDGDVLYRPWRPHTNPQPITPGEVEEYVIEVFPVGHVLRPGHRLMVKVSAPPALDSVYAYVPTTAPSINTVHHSSEHPSRLTVPLQPIDSGDLGPALPCGAQEAVRCVAEPNG